MRQYERHGVYVDQCTECRGIFLDRGELEQLIDAEARWGAGAPAPLVGGDWDDDPRRHQGLGGHQTSRHKKRKRSFLEGLFDD